jgi:phosphoglycerate dehydrogenase-like enzyme
MMRSSRPIIVIEDDPFLRFLQIVLNPAAPPNRVAAFSHFLAHDLPDLFDWCNRVRARIGGIYPAEVRFAADEAALLANLLGAHVLLVQDFAVGAREISAGGGTLKILQKYGTITSRIDRSACERAGVRVLTVRRRANISTAEQALTLMLALARQLHRNANLISFEQLQAAGFSPTRYDRAETPNGNWGRITGLKTLYDRQLGIVGLGEIGRELAIRAAALGMRIVYTQRQRLAQAEERIYQATYCTLDELLVKSDCVSLHLPRGPETRSFIGRRELSLVKPGAFLINVAQPQLVDREALRERLESGRLGGYGMDTFYDEPGDADDPLLKFSNVIITPHLGGSPRFNTLDDFEEVLVNIDQALNSADRVASN